MGVGCGAEAGLQRCTVSLCSLHNPRFYPAGDEPETQIKQCVSVFTVASPFRVLSRRAERRAEMGAGELAGTEEVEMKAVHHVDSGCLGIFSECHQSTATD